MTRIFTKDIANAVSSIITDEIRDNVLYTNDKGLEIKGSDVLDWFSKKLDNAAKVNGKAKARADKKKEEERNNIAEKMVTEIRVNGSEPMTSRSLAEALDNEFTSMKLLNVAKAMPETFVVKDNKGKGGKFIGLNE